MDFPQPRKDAYGRTLFFLNADQSVALNRISKEGPNDAKG